MAALSNPLRNAQGVIYLSHHVNSLPCDLWPGEGQGEGSYCVALGGGCFVYEYIVRCVII